MPPQKASPKSAVVDTVHGILERLTDSRVKLQGDEERYISKWPERVDPDLRVGDHVHAGIDNTGRIRTLTLGSSDPWDETPDPAPATAPPPPAATPAPPPPAAANGNGRGASDMIRCSAVKAAAELVAELIRTGALRNLEEAEAALQLLARTARGLLMD